MLNESRSLDGDGQMVGAGLKANKSPSSNLPAQAAGACAATVGAGSEPADSLHIVSFTTARQYPPSALADSSPQPVRVAFEAMDRLQDDLVKADSLECERISRWFETVALSASRRSQMAMSMAELRQGSLGPKYADTLREQIDAINAVEEARKQAGC